MRRTKEGFVPSKDDKPKDAENSPFEASSVLGVKANRRGFERSTVFAANSTQYYVKMLDNTPKYYLCFFLVLL